MSAEYGKRLKIARKHAKLTQKVLALRAGITQSTLSELETIAGGSAFTAQLAEQCGVNARWLAAGDGSMLDGFGSAPRIAQPTTPYRSIAPNSADTTVAQLATLLRLHTPTRRRTLADLLHRFALDPADAELATELVGSLHAPSAASGKRSAA